jgi:transcriptional regulator with XRE-family HTH domain
VNGNQRIAERVRDRRSAHGISLDALAGKSAVSRSMSEIIEASDLPQRR